MTFTIPGKLDDGQWYGPPFSMEEPGTVSAWFGDYPGWRQAWDHDSDPTTPPRDMGPHKGIDIYGAAPKQLLRAAADGKVIFAGTSGLVPARGNHVMLQHEDGFTSYYMHMSDIDVHVGDEVQANDELGPEGASGWVTGRHVHFALHNKEEASKQGLSARLSGYVDASAYLRDPDAPLPPSPFEPRLASSGVTLTRYEGGSVDELNAALDAEGAISASVATSGAYGSYITNAPAFVNAGFRELFPAGVPGGTIMVVVTAGG